MDDTDIVTRIKYLGDMELELRAEGYTRRTRGTLVIRTDEHEDGTKTEYKYIEINEYAFDAWAERITE